MKKLAELKKKLAALKAEGLGLLNKADSLADGLTAEDQVRLDAIQAEVAETQRAITQAEEMQEQRRSLEAIVSSPALSTTVHDTDPKKTFGFKGISEFAIAVRNATGGPRIVDPRLMMGAPSNVHQGGAASGEGFDVPPQYRDQIFEVMIQQDEFGPLVDEEPTEAREVKMNADETTPWGSSGVQANWRSEGTQMTASKLVTDPRNVPLHELYAFVLATEELLADSPRLNSRLTRKAGAALAWKKNEALMFGTGAGQPLGWMNSGALVTVAAESGQTATTINVANVTKMFSRLLRVPGDRPIWVGNPDIIPQLMQMVVGQEPVFMPPSGLYDAPGGILMGLPVMLTEHAQTLGVKGDLQLLSPKGYYCARRDGGPQFASSMHLYFDYAIDAFRWSTRFGGQPYLSAPVTPAKGSTTKSHFVTLAAR